MDKTLKNKLIEIGVDKIIIGLIFFVLGFFANKSLENFKLVQAQRVGDTTEFVTACKETWSKVYEYENTIDKLDGAHSSRWFYDGMLNEKDLKKQDVEIELINQLSEKQLYELQKITNKQKFIIGDKLVMHFWKYVGLVKARSDAKQDALGSKSYNSKFDTEVVESFNKLIASMRFDASAAREYAIAKMP